MRELSLFSGAGGGLLGTKLLGWEAVGYVEFNEYCQRVLRARIDDGILDDAPIFGDIRAFISEGYARAYKGMVDVVSGGFPCQPFSHAGKRAGQDDSRNMWGETLEVIRQVRPRFAFLENVSGLLSIDDGRYFGRILGDLGESGYDVRWRVLSAAEVGAPHKRDRLWIVAHTVSESAGCESGFTGTDRGRRTGGNESPLLQEKWQDGANRTDSADRAEGEMGDTKHDGRTTPEILSHTNSEGNTGLPSGEEEAFPISGISCEAEYGGGGENISDSMRERLERCECARGTDKERREVENGHAVQRSQVWWDSDPADETGTAQPELGRVAHGVDNRMDRLKAIGNGQVPAVVAEAWRLLSEGLV